MKVKVLDRDDISPIPFREHLLKLLRTKGDTLILGYGYLEDGAIDDLFLDSLRDGFSECDIPNIYIIGSNQKKIEINSNIKVRGYVLKYLKLAGKINNIMNNRCGIHVQFAQQYNYHKKIAIKIRNDNPEICILGSSNISTRTYSVNEDSNSKFNQEVDVLIWNSFNPEVNELLNEQNEMDGFNVQYCVDFKFRNKIINMINYVYNSNQLISYNLIIDQQREEILNNMYEEMKNIAHNSNASNENLLLNYQLHFKELIQKGKNVLNLIYIVSLEMGRSGYNFGKTLTYLDENRAMYEEVISNLHDLPYLRSKYRFIP